MGVLLLKLAMAAGTPTSPARAAVKVAKKIAPKKRKRV
jgi:hypothetical protein